MSANAQSSMRTFAALLLLSSIASAAQPGDEFKDCRDCPDMMVVPAGQFSKETSAGGTVQIVRLARAFAVGKFEITRAQYARFVAASKRAVPDKCFVFQGVNEQGVGQFAWSAGKNWRDPGYAQTDSDPVVCVSWEDAQAYIVWLNQQTGKTYRLLSETEWEYAARAGSSTVQWWNDDTSCIYVNSADRSFKRLYPSLSDASDCDDGHAFTAPVGSYKPNGFGLYDMLGNAWEWTEDCEHGNSTGAPMDGTAWIRDGDCSKRVRRSGSWYRPVTANRSALPAADWHGNGGFRVARAL